MKDEIINGHRIRCFHDARTPLDPSTVVYLDEPASATDPRLRTCFGESGHGAGFPGRHLGRRVPFLSLPAHLQREVRRELSFVSGPTRLVTLAAKAVTA